MLPILLDASHVRAGLAGAGDAFARRLTMLREAGIGEPAIFETRTPTTAEIASLTILFVAGLDEPQSSALAKAARAAGVLVNVEDVPPLCDFHMPAQVRRGDLIFTVSTGGCAPGLSRLLREDLSTRYGPEWASYLETIASMRAQWRKDGAKPSEVAAQTRAFVAAKAWLR